MMRRILFTIALLLGTWYAYEAGQMIASKLLTPEVWQVLAVIGGGLSLIMLFTFVLTERVALFLSTIALFCCGTAMLVFDGIVNWPYLQFFEQDPTTQLAIKAVIIGIELIVFFTAFHALIPKDYGWIRHKVKLSNGAFTLISLGLTFGIMFAVDRSTELKNDPAKVAALRDKKIEALGTLAEEYKQADYITSMRCRTSTCDPSANLTEVTREISQTIDQQIDDEQNRTYSLSQVVGPMWAIMLHAFRALILVLGGSQLLEWAGYNIARLMEKEPRVQKPKLSMKMAGFFERMTTKVGDSVAGAFASVKDAALRSKNFTQQKLAAAKNAAKRTQESPQSTPPKPPKGKPNLHAVDSPNSAPKTRPQKQSSNDIYEAIARAVKAGDLAVKSINEPTVNRDDVRDFFGKSSKTDSATARWNREARKLGSKLLSRQGIA